MHSVSVVLGVTDGLALSPQCNNSTWSKPIDPPVTRIQVYIVLMCTAESIESWTEVNDLRSLWAQSGWVNRSATAQ